MTPTPQDIAAARATARLTQAEAAATIAVAPRTWQDWERGVARMPAGLYRLFLHTAGIKRIPFRSQP